MTNEQASLLPFGSVVRHTSGKLYRVCFPQDGGAFLTCRALKADRVTPVGPCRRIAAAALTLDLLAGS